MVNALTSPFVVPFLLTVASASLDEAQQALLRAQAAHAAGDGEAAAQILREAVKVAPAASVTSFELGNCLFAPLQAAFEAGHSINDARASQAESAFRAAIAVDPDGNQRSTPLKLKAPLGMAYNNLANLVSVRGRHTEAEHLLRMGLKLQPIAYQYNGLASLLLRRANVGKDSSTVLHEAADLLNTAIAHERNFCASGPSREDMYRENLADALARLGRSAEAAHQLSLARAMQRSDGHNEDVESHSTLNSKLVNNTFDGTSGSTVSDEIDGSDETSEVTVSHVVQSDNDIDDSTRRARRKLQRLDGTPVSPNPAFRPQQWQDGRPLLVMLVPSDLSCTLPSEQHSNSLHTCDCPATFGTLQDISATAAALGRMGFAVEVCACVPLVELGVDANNTLWVPSEAYEASASQRGRHVLVQVDTEMPNRFGGQVASRWLWRRHHHFMDTARPCHNDSCSASDDAKTVFAFATPVTSGSSAYRLDGVLESDLDLLLATTTPIEGKARFLTEEVGRDGIMPQTLRRIRSRPVLLDASSLLAGYGASRSRSMFCYTQPVGVGLAELLRIWPEVHAARPKARLVIYSCTTAMGMADCAAARVAATKSIGVTVLEEELIGGALTASLAGCSFDLIPVVEPRAVELGSLLRAQAAGAIPVSTRHLKSVLPEGCGRWDLGPAPTNSSIADSAHVRAEWVATVLALGSRRLKDHRKSMRLWAAAVYTHQDAASQWHTAFTDQLTAAASSEELPSVPSAVALPAHPPAAERNLRQRLEELESQVATEAALLSELSETVSSLEARLAACEAESARRQAHGEYPDAELEEHTGSAETHASSPALQSVERQAQTAHADDEHAALCWIVLLDRPGGIDAAIHAARLQTERRFQQILLDRLHAQRMETVKMIAADARVLVAHVPVPKEAKWTLTVVWQLSQRILTPLDHDVQVVVIVRQFVWVPSCFVAQTLAFHGNQSQHTTPQALSSSKRDAHGARLLLYPIWQFKVPESEVREASLSSMDSVQLFDPPLNGSYSSRGWQMTRRLRPSQTAPLDGFGATRWKQNVASHNVDILPGGVWSFASAHIDTISRGVSDSIPAFPDAEHDACFLPDKQVKGVTATAPKKSGIRPMLAGMELRCEVIETSAWLPASLWKRNSRTDGTGCS